MRIKRQIACVTGIMGLLISSSIHGSTPSEMADMSLQELLNIQVEERITPTTGSQTYQAGPWRAGIAYSRMELDGYLDGSDEVSNSAVLFSGVPGTRTDKNFPVLPTVITQEAVILTMRYELDSRQTIDLGIPYILQSTEHLSVVPGYDNFTIKSEGLGDISLSYSSTIKEWKSKQLRGTVGISVPTGSIDQKGDTPRAAGDQQLPYTMQLGSGTWDLSAGLNYQQQQNTLAWGTQLHGKLRGGKNDRDYRLGNRASLSAWAKSYHHAWIRPSVKLRYQYWDIIHGEDTEITVPGPFPYPAGITNPKFYGGRKVSASLGVSIGGGNSPLKGNSVDLEIGKPIYQNLNGVQPKEVLRFNIHWTMKL